MKAVVVLLVLAGGAYYFLSGTMKGIDDGFDAAEQGKQIRAAIVPCKTWTEVLDKAQPPKKWRDGPSAFDYNYTDRFDDTTRELIAKRIESKDMSDGFSFLYRFSDAVTFAVNFDHQGNLNNIQDVEGKGDLMD